VSSYKYQRFPGKNPLVQSYLFVVTSSPDLSVLGKRVMSGDFSRVWSMRSDIVASMELVGSPVCVLHETRMAVSMTPAMDADNFMEGDIERYGICEQG
jgi:hypothetical protein